MATHSSVLAWRIPGTEEPGRLLSMGSRRVRHDGSDLAAAAAAAAACLYCSNEIILLENGTAQLLMCKMAVISSSPPTHVSSHIKR